MATLESWIDYRGRTVELTEEAWAHIIDNHPEMADSFRDVGTAITSPSVVVRDPNIHRVEQHYGMPIDGLRVRVIVLYRPTPAGWIGDVHTAHRTARIKKGEPLWP